MTLKERESYYLYYYHKSLGNKHSGKKFLDNAEAVISKVKDGIGCKDVCEIRVTDGLDSMVIHWTEKAGIIGPKELRTVEEFRPLPSDKRLVFIPIKRRELRMEDVLSPEIIEENSRIRKKRNRDERI